MCGGGAYVVGAECRVTADAEPLPGSVAPPAFLSCNASGSLCLNADGGHNCLDYEVQYQCRTPGECNERSNAIDATVRHMWISMTAFGVTYIFMAYSRLHVRLLNRSRVSLLICVKMY